MDLLLFIVVLVLMLGWRGLRVWGRRKRQQLPVFPRKNWEQWNKKQQEDEEQQRQLNTFLRFFLRPACVKCLSEWFWIESVAPNGRAITVRCGYCRKRTIEKAREAQKSFLQYLDKYGQMHVSGLQYPLGEERHTQVSHEEREHERENGNRNEPSHENGHGQDHFLEEGLISQKVQDMVWQRDKGKCVRCGSEEHLSFDPIVPHEKGGTDSEGNVQLLCRHCQRKKKAEEVRV